MAADRGVGATRLLEREGELQALDRAISSNEGLKVAKERVVETQGRVQESKTNFLGAVREGVATATARPLHAGSTTVVVETLVTDAHGGAVAKVTQTQLVLRPRQ